MKKDIKDLEMAFKISFVVILLIGIFAFPKEPYKDEDIKYTATVTIDANPQQVFQVYSSRYIESHARWGHNNLNCCNISSTAPIIVTNQRKHVTTSTPVNLFWTRFWFITILIVVWIMGSLGGFAFSK